MILANVRSDQLNVYLVGRVAKEREAKEESIFLMSPRKSRAGDRTIWYKIHA